MNRKMRYLTDLEKGEKGIVVDVETENCPEKGRGFRRRMRHRGSACGTRCASRWGSIQRLMELGLTPGTEVTILNSAPFYGPLEVCVRGCKIALGRELASRILVMAEVKK
nr:FeoA family protein [Candidatus Njordarchaeota archaeon]